MHYIVHVFTEPGGSVADALKPFQERDADDGTFVGEWDWWTEGGRWEGHFDGKNQVTADQARVIETTPETPYVYLTLKGEWRPAELWDGQDWNDVEGYEQGYKDYLASVPDVTVVTAVDIHS